MNLFGSNFNFSNPELKVAMIGTYPPIKCGIATFTSDLSSSIRDSALLTAVDIIALKEEDSLSFPSEVVHAIAVDSRDAYVAAAEAINERGYDVVSIQHEYGIFGGVAGSLLLDLVWQVNCPIVTTLHTVLEKPSLTQKLVLEALLDRSSRIVVMSHKAVELLIKVHGIDPTKIDMIPHGVPLVPKSVDPQFRMGIPAGAPMILTFGLLSPDKGIETVIEAMPEILEANKDATYVVVGQTHPHVLDSKGETYRESLSALALDLGVESSVRFINRFVSHEELIGYLSAMDIYVTPYLNPHQITSGTLAYAIGAGKAVLSTPYWYAQELLSEGRGLLFPFGDSEKLAEAVVSIERDPHMRRAMGLAAETYGRSMRWDEVGVSYQRSISRVVQSAPHPERSAQYKPLDSFKIAEPRTTHLEAMSDDTGILQHAIFSTPRRSDGYCVDDNARALLFTALEESRAVHSDRLQVLQGIYLSFIQDACHEATGRFRNFYSYQRNWLESEGSEDSHGRTLWALGSLIHLSKNLSRRSLAKSLFDSSSRVVDNFTSPRAWAFSVLGMAEYLQVFPHDLITRTRFERLAVRLADQLEEFRDGSWNWFEDSVTYDNARLPQSLLVAGNTLINGRLIRAGLASLEWLREIQTSPEGLFVPVGSNGWFEKGQQRPSQFDQQPLEAAASVSAYLAAWNVTGRATWLTEADRAYRWFAGDNSLGLPLAHAETGACCDGLHIDRVNRNQGAESTLAYLCASSELLRSMERSQRTPLLVGLSHGK